MKKAMLWFLLAMLLLTLTACGEAKKYEEAQALMKGGAYSEAYEAFAELGRYEDAKQLAEDAKWALYAQAQEDLRLGRYQEAMDAVEPFLHNVNMKALYQYAEAGLAGTYVRDLIWHEGSISCDVAIAQGLPGADVRIELESKGGALQGKVYATARSLDQENPQAHFSITDYATGEGYRLDAVNLNSFRYTIPAKKPHSMTTTYSRRGPCCYSKPPRCFSRQLPKTVARAIPLRGMWGLWSSTQFRIPLREAS